MTDPMERLAGCDVYSRSRDAAGSVIREEGGSVLAVLTDNASDLVELDRGDVISPSGHSRERWRQYVDGDGGPLDVGRSWFSAEEIPGEAFDAEEARYDPDARVVLLRQQETVVTVMPERNLNQTTEREIRELDP